MTISFRCTCGAAYQLRDEFAGRTLPCPRCGNPTVVGPAPEPVVISHEMIAPPPEAAMISSDMFAPAVEDVPLPAHAEVGRQDFERGMPMAPVLTLGLIVLITVIFFFQMSSGSLESREAIILAGALTRDHVLGLTGSAGPQPWRLFSAMFLHGSPDHLFGNAVALYILGLACEHAFGFGRMALIYLLAGLGGSLFSIALSPGPSVGASGAIFGLMGATVIFFRKHGRHFVLRDNRVGWVLLAWAVYSIATGLLQPFIDNGAHIGGFLTGALVAALLDPAILHRPPSAPRRT
jgi:rhomboid protease GluP